MGSCTLCSDATGEIIECGALSTLHAILHWWRIDALANACPFWLERRGLTVLIMHVDCHVVCLACEINSPSANHAANQGSGRGSSAESPRLVYLSSQAIRSVEGGTVRSRMLGDARRMCTDAADAFNLPYNGLRTDTNSRRARLASDPTSS